MCNNDFNFLLLYKYPKGIENRSFIFILVSPFELQSFSYLACVCVCVYLAPLIYFFFIMSGQRASAHPSKSNIKGDKKGEKEHTHRHFERCRCRHHRSQHKYVSRKIYFLGFSLNVRTNILYGPIFSTVTLHSYAV